jgi:hypothetical protein
MRRAVLRAATLSVCLGAGAAALYYGYREIPDHKSQPEAPSPERARFGPATISGILRVGGAPLPAARLAFQRVPGARFEAVTDSRGKYEVAVRRSGDFTVNLYVASHLLSTSRFATFKDGQNSYDLDLPDTAITLRTKLPAQVKTLQIQISGPYSPTATELAGFVTAAEAAKGIKLVGVGLGDYKAFVTAPGGWSSTAPGFATLDAARTRAEVVFELTQRPLAVSVRDDKDRPIGHARVDAGPRSLHVGGSEGLFDANEVAAGEPMVIAADGFVPTCRVAAAGPGIQVVRLKRSGAELLTIQLQPAPSLPIGELDGFPGSDCPVPVSRLKTTVHAEKTPGRLRFDVHGAPRGAYKYRVASTAPYMDVGLDKAMLDYTIPAGCKLCVPLAQ